MTRLSETPENIVRGLRVHLALGASCDTTLGSRTRARSFVADDDAPDGRRIIPADLDADGNERAPDIALVICRSIGSRGSLPVEIDWQDGSRCTCDAADLEQAGPVPVEAIEARARQESDAAAAAEAALAGRDAIIADLSKRLGELEAKAG